jgi:type IV secretory pathway VirD2 relaxase
MSAKPPDEPTDRVHPRFSRTRESRQPRLLARVRIGPHPKSALATAVRSAGRGTASRAGRGAGVRFAGRHAQRVVIKARIVPVRGKSPADAVRRHLAYLSRDGVDRQGAPGRLFGTDGELDREQIDAFAERGLECRHQFRFIVSPERGGELDLERFTRDLMRRMQHDVGSRLDYVACAHHDTDQPHVHIIVNGREARGGDLVVSRDYIGNGLRQRAMELATNELGFRTDLDVFRSLARDIRADRYTALDRRLQMLQERDGFIDLRTVPTAPRAVVQRRLYLGRLSHLQKMGLAQEGRRGRWRLHPQAIERLRGHTQHRAVQQQAERHLEPGDRGAPLTVIDKAKLAQPVTGRVLGRGLANELTGTDYIIVSGIDGKTYYAALSTHSERHLEAPVRRDDIVSLRREVSRPTGQADRNIVAFAARSDGIYDAQRHANEIRDRRLPYDATPERFVAAHVARLEALASRGLVARESEGRYRVPPDLIARLDTEPAPARDDAFVKVERIADESLSRQSSARAYTWLDEQLIAGTAQSLRQAGARNSFQNELLEALDRRVRQLVQLGLAELDGEGVRLDPQLRDALGELERRTLVVRLSKQYGTFVELEHTGDFAGRVAAIESLHGKPHAAVASGAHFTLVPAERGLHKLIGQDVALNLSRNRDVDHAPQVRFRALDAPDLSFGLSR